MRIGLILSVCILIAVIVFYSCGSNSTQAQTNAVQAPANGSGVYADNCIVCHGKDGKAGISGAADLSKSKLTHEQVVDVITNGRNGMRAFRELSREEIEAVAWYIESLRK